jgi:hypothetical protein
MGLFHVFSACVVGLSMSLSGLVSAEVKRPERLQSVVVPFHADAASAESVVLRNDSFVDGGGQAYLQMGFVAGEKAGVWLKVPEQYPFFKVDFFRVLFGSSQMNAMSGQIFFQMSVADQPSKGIPWEIENAAQITPGPYWNDIPAIGEPVAHLSCARGGQYIGASLEFTHSGVPSVYRDLDGISDARHNVLYSVPDGWNYSAAYGLRGDWILRVVGHPATAEECRGS